MMSSEQVVLITGTSRGIGRYLAEYFLSRGARVAGCSRNAADISSRNYTHYSLNVSDEIAVKAMFSSIRKQYNRLDILVNNAGVASMNHCLLTPISTFDKIFSINVRGLFLVSREAAKLMQQRKFGRIVNIGSFAVPLRVEGEAVYVASKSAVISLSQVMARELASFGITVNVVGPTVIKTDIVRGVPQEKLDRLTNRLAIKRFGTFADVVNVINFFIQPESDYITGQVIYLGGVYGC